MNCINCAKQNNQKMDELVSNSLDFINFGRLRGKVPFKKKNSLLS